jgi:hypothetical protein
MVVPLAANRLQENPNRKHKLWNLVSTEIYFVSAERMSVRTYKRKVHNWNIEITSHVVKFNSQPNLVLNYKVVKRK